jgi:hypothetical protein
MKKNAMDMACVACGEQERGLEDRGVDRRIILKWNSRKRMRERPGWAWFMTRTVGRLL